MNTKPKRNWALPGFGEKARDAGMRFFKNPLTLPQVPTTPKNVRIWQSLSGGPGEPVAYAHIQIGKARIKLGKFRKETLELAARSAAAMADTAQVFFEPYKATARFGKFNCGDEALARNMLEDEQGLVEYFAEVEQEIRKFGVQTRDERAATREAHLVHSPSLRHELITAVGDLKGFFEKQAPALAAVGGHVNDATDALARAILRIDQQKATVDEIHQMIANRITPKSIDTDAKRRILSDINSRLRAYGQSSIPTDVATTIVEQAILQA